MSFEDPCTQLNEENNLGTLKPIDQVIEAMERESIQPDDEEFIKQWREKYCKELGDATCIPDKYLERLIKITNSKLIEAFAKNSEGLDIDSVNRFMRQQGETAIPFVFLDIDNSDYRIAKQIIDENAKIFSTDELNNFHQRSRDVSMGCFEQNLKFVFVGRNRRAEEIYGQICTLKTLVHELCHANNNNSPQIKKKGDSKVFVGRCGLGVASEVFENGVVKKEKYFGSFLEEGFVDMKSAEFVKQCCNKKEKKDFETRIDVRQIDLNNVIPIRGSSKYELLPIPAKYLFNYNDELHVPELAGYAVELLCEAIPQLEGHMRDARTSYGGIKNVHKDLDSFNHGLYIELQKGNYDFTTFFEKLALVIKLTKVSVENIIEENTGSNHELKEKWNDTIKKNERKFRK